MDKFRLSNTINLYSSREEVLLLALCSVVRASSELAVRKNRTNPLFPQGGVVLVGPGCLERGEGRGCRPAQRPLLLLKLLFRAVANRVDKVPVSLPACSAVERVNFLKETIPTPFVQYSKQQWV